MAEQQNWCRGFPRGADVTEPGRSKHQQVADYVRSLIDSGQLRPGGPAPTEQELMEHFGYSRETIRKGVELLVSAGMVTEGQGRAGRRVAEAAPMVFHMTRSESRQRMGERTAGEPASDAWVADVREQGREPGQSISVAIEEADAQIAAALEVAAGSHVVVRRRIRTADGKAHNLNTTYYPRDIAAGTRIELPGDITEGVIAYMATGLGHVQVRYVDDLSARMPSPDEQRQLDLGRGVPVLVQMRTGYTSERPVKVTVTVWPGPTHLIYESPA